MSPDAGSGTAERNRRGVRAGADDGNGIPFSRLRVSCRTVRGTRSRIEVALLRTVGDSNSPCPEMHILSRLYKQVRQLSCIRSSGVYLLRS